MQLIEDIKLKNAQFLSSSRVLLKRDYNNLLCASTTFMLSRVRLGECSHLGGDPTFLFSPRNVEDVCVENASSCGDVECCLSVQAKRERFIARSTLTPTDNTI